jgi:tetratricopeptide (TPR) repeat protein
VQLGRIGRCDGDKTDRCYRGIAIDVLVKDGQFDKALKICQRYIGIRRRHPYSIAWELRVIVEAIGKLEDNIEAQKLLSMALTTTETIDDSYTKARVLTDIAEAYIQLGDNTEAEKLLSQALSVAMTINHSKTGILSAIAESQAKSGNWRNAHYAASFCPINDYHDCRVESLTKILTVWAEQSEVEDN